MNNTKYDPQTIEVLPQSESTYKTLQPFQSVEDMNTAVKEHKQANELTQTDRDILDAISRYSCKYAGVCYLSKANISTDAGYMSRRTAIRSCNRLEALGIIEQYETRRVRGDRRRSSNVIVIKAVESEPITSTDKDEQQDDNITESHRQVTTNSHGIEPSFKASSSRDTYKRLEQDEQSYQPSTSDIIKRGLKHAIPTAIYDALSPYYDGQALYDTYGILLRAKARIDRSIMLETYGNQYVDAFYNVIRLYKSGKVRKSLSGLLYVTWEQLSSEISRQIQAECVIGI